MATEGTRNSRQGSMGGMNEGWPKDNKALADLLEKSDPEYWSLMLWRISPDYLKEAAKTIIKALRK